MAQRPPTYIALLGGRVKFTIALSNSHKCWRLPGYEDVVGLKTDSSLWKNRLLVLSSEVYWFLHLYMSFLASKDDRVLCVFEICCRVQTDLRRSFVNLSWLQRVRNIWRWRSVMKIIEFGSDWLLKHVLSELLATTFKLWRPQCTICDICVLWPHRLFTFHSWVMTCGVIGGKVQRNPWQRTSSSDWSFWNAGDQQEVVKFDLTSYLITWWPRVGPCVLFFQVCPVRYPSRVQNLYLRTFYHLSLCSLSAILRQNKHSR